MDLIMLTTVNAKERELDDWKDLFREADLRFEFLKAWKPEKSRTWFLEWKWSP
jgi:hypothetical protein